MYGVVGGGGGGGTSGIVKTSSLFYSWRVSYCIYCVFHTCTYNKHHFTHSEVITICLHLLSNLFTRETFTTCARSLLIPARDVAHILSVSPANRSESKGVCI